MCMKDMTESLKTGDLSRIVNENLGFKQIYNAKVMNMMNAEDHIRTGCMQFRMEKERIIPNG